MTEHEKQLLTAIIDLQDKGIIDLEANISGIPFTIKLGRSTFEVYEPIKKYLRRL